MTKSCRVSTTAWRREEEDKNARIPHLLTKAKYKPSQAHSSPTRPRRDCSRTDLALFPGNNQSSIKTLGFGLADHGSKSAVSATHFSPSQTNTKVWCAGLEASTRNTQHNKQEESQRRELRTQLPNLDLRPPRQLLHPHLAPFCQQIRHPSLSHNIQRSALPILASDLDDAGARLGDQLRQLTRNGRDGALCFIQALAW